MFFPNSLILFLDSRFLYCLPSLLLLSFIPFLLHFIPPSIPSYLMPSFSLSIFESHYLFSIISLFFSFFFLPFIPPSQFPSFFASFPFSFFFFFISSAILDSHFFISSSLVLPHLFYGCFSFSFLHCLLLFLHPCAHSLLIFITIFFSFSHFLSFSFIPSLPPPCLPCLPLSFSLFLPSSQYSFVVSLPPYFIHSIHHSFQLSIHQSFIPPRLSHIYIVGSKNATSSFVCNGSLLP